MTSLSRASKMGGGSVECFFSFSFLTACSKTSSYKKMDVGTVEGQKALEKLLTIVKVCMPVQICCYNICCIVFKVMGRIPKKANVFNTIALEITIFILC